MSPHLKWFYILVCWSSFTLASSLSWGLGKNFFSLSAIDVSGRKVHFSQYRGKVVLIVNTASNSGFAPQLTELEQLYKKYSGRGFVVLAFPSNDFRQETKDNAELASLFRKQYGVTFPLFNKAAVRGHDKQPVYEFLTDEKPGVIFKEISWNFEKFLVNRQGQVIERWNSLTSPSSKTITSKLEKALSDPI